jgi:hypothetical protein
MHSTPTMRDFPARIIRQIPDSRVQTSANDRGVHRHLYSLFLVTLLISDEEQSAELPSIFCAWSRGRIKANVRSSCLTAEGRVDF